MLISSGSTNVTTYFAMRLAADGTAATGLTETNFTLQYVRSGAAPSAASTATAGTAGGAAAHVDDSVVEPDATDQPGLYRIDWPDAAFAAGAREVILTAKVATAFTEHLRCQIDAAVNIATVSATEVIPEFIHFCDGVTSRSIISLNAGFAGTLALEPDIGKSTISTVNSAALTGAASVTGSSLRMDTSKRRALYTVAALSVAGTYTATVSVTTTDSQTISSTGKIVVQ